MRLLNAQIWRDKHVLKLEDLYGDAIRPYAILSHVWGKHEVSFQDLVAGEYIEKEGFTKIRHTLDQALEDGLDYAWVDTC